MITVRCLVTAFLILSTCGLWATPIEIGLPWSPMGIVRAAPEPARAGTFVSPNIFQTFGVPTGFGNDSEMGVELSGGRPANEYERLGGFKLDYGIDHDSPILAGSADSVQVAWTQTIPEPSSFLLLVTSLFSVVCVERENLCKLLKFLGGRNLA